MDSLRELITATNIYIKNVTSDKNLPDKLLLYNIAAYVTKIVGVFGAIRKEDQIGFPSQHSNQNVDVCLYHFTGLFSFFFA